MKSQTNPTPTLGIDDVAKNRNLAKHFETLELADYFDERGHRLYSNLSMSIAAKNCPDVGSSFGSTSILGAAAAVPHKSKQTSARAYRLATEMVRKDREINQQRSVDQFMSLNDGEKVQISAVQRRQEQLFFYEVPTENLVLPKGCSIKDLLPSPASTRTQEREDRARFFKFNKDLLDGSHRDLHAITNQISWISTQHDLTEIIQWSSAWVASTGVPLAEGMDRSTFCLFLLDLGLADQREVPYVWAVTLFDKYSSMLRICGRDSENSDSNLEGRVPVMPVVNAWDLVRILNSILRNRTSTPNADDFLRHLRGLGIILQSEWFRLDKEEMTVGSSMRAVPQTENGNSASRKKGATAKRNRFRNAAAAFSSPVREPPPSGNPSENSGIDASAWKRNRLISGMIIEPEVIQVVEQHRRMFVALYESYAYDEDPGLEDWQVREDRFGVATHLGKQGTMDFGSVLQLCHDFGFIPRLASRHEVWRAYRSSGGLGAGVLERGQDDQRMKESHKIPKIVLFRQAGEANYDTCGVSVLAETLCRVAFGYLLAYGNSVQLDSNSRAKTVWLIAYLQQAAINLQKSHGRRVENSRPPTQGQGSPASRCSTARCPTATSTTTSSSTTSRRFAKIWSSLCEGAFTGGELPLMQKIGPLMKSDRDKQFETNRQVAPEQNSTRRSSAYTVSQVSSSNVDFPTSLPTSPANSVSSGRSFFRVRRTVSGALMSGESAPQVPKDDFKFNAVLFSRLLRCSAIGVSGYDTLANHYHSRAADTPTCRLSPREGLEAAVKGPIPVAHACSLPLEMEALTKRLDESAPNFDRCELTPPPMSNFAVQLSNRVDKMMGAARCHFDG